MTTATTLIVLDAAICAALCLRLVFYRRRGSQFRPVASLVAYLITIAAGAVPLLAMLGRLPSPDPATVFLHFVLLVALLAARGNVVEIFHTADYDNCIYRWLKRDRRHDRKIPQG